MARISRRTSKLLVVALVVVAAAGFAAAFALDGQSNSSNASQSLAPPLSPRGCPWLNASQPVQRRVAELLGAMTLQEKIAEMQAVDAPGNAFESTIPAQPSLCIPALPAEDGDAGVSHLLPGGTQFPDPETVAAAWSRSLSEEYGRAIATEMKAKGIAMALAPMVDIVRDPRWGRTFETLGEDPYLSSKLGAAEIGGIQSDGVMADAKHYFAYNEESNRGKKADDVLVSEQALHEIYLPSFHSAVEAGSASVMCALSSPNGTYSCDSQSFLEKTLDRRWNYGGFIRADNSAVSSATDATAGLDTADAVGEVFTAAGALASDVESGQVSIAEVNDAVRRTLTQMFRFGLFNHRLADHARRVVTSAAHKALAEKLAADGTVLLKNDGGILPLGSESSGAQSIAVIGPDAGTAPVTAGGGSSYVIPLGGVVTPYKAIASAAPPGTAVHYAEGITAGSAHASAAEQQSLLRAAVNTAASAKVAIVFAGNKQSEGWDLPNIDLQGNQDKLIDAVAAANPNTVVVLNTGSAVTMPWLSHVKAVVEAWYPGQEDGNAIASVLFGRVDPGGHLTMTFPQSLSQVPASSPAEWPGVNGAVHYSEGIDVGYRWYDSHDLTPLFPFGYGLSYTTFRFSSLHITAASSSSRSSGSPREPAISNATSTPAPSSCGCNGQSTPIVDVSATVTNTGSVTGSDVAQIYVGDPSSAGEPPRQLQGFRRVTLRPGQSAEVHFALDGHALSYWNDAANGWVLPDGKYSVYVGDSSALANLPLQGSFQMVKTLGALTASASASSASSAVSPGSPVTVSATFHDGGDFTLSQARISLDLPSGWTAKMTSPPAGTTIATNQSVSESWSVTPPLAAQGAEATVLARLEYVPVGAGSVVKTTEASVPLTVAPLVSITARGAPTPIKQGGSVGVSVRMASNVGSSLTLDYSSAGADGIALSSSSGSAQVGTSWSTEELRVTAASGAPPGIHVLQVESSINEGGHVYSLQVFPITVWVPFPTLASAFNNAGISSSDDEGAANLDGLGGSYSQQALDKARLNPGARVSYAGTSFPWPSASAGHPDNVALEGQMISLSGSGSSLGFLGAGTGGNRAALCTILYADGTRQTFTLHLSDWQGTAPQAQDKVYAKIAGFNFHAGSGSGVGSEPVPTSRSVSVFYTSVPLERGTPVFGLLLGVNKWMHIFSIGIAG